MGSEERQRPDRSVDVLYKNDEIVVYKETLGPDTAVPWHYHTNVQDLFFVVKGPIRICTGDPKHSVDLVAGETYRVAPTVPHTVINMDEVHEVEWILIQGLGKCDSIRLDLGTEKKA